MPPIHGFAVYAEVHPGGDFTAEEWEFVSAVAAYQKRWRRRYPSWREAFHILRALGYRKVAPPTPLPRLTEPERELAAQALQAAAAPASPPPDPSPHEPRPPGSG